MNNEKETANEEEVNLFVVGLYLPTYVYLLQVRSHRKYNPIYSLSPCLDKINVTTDYYKIMAFHKMSIYIYDEENHIRIHIPCNTFRNRRNLNREN